VAVIVSGVALVKLTVQSASLVVVSTGTAVQPEIWLPVSLKLTVPPSGMGDTVAA
jgi:hypothetical protein